MKNSDKVTPCCHSRYWHPVLRSDIPSGVERCELCDKLFDYEDLILLETKGEKTMKRYLVLGELYDFDLDHGGEEGVIGSVDSLDDIPDPNVVGEVIDTTTGKVYEYNGVKWELDGDVPDGVETKEDSTECTPQEGLEWPGVPYWVDMEKGSDDNDGLDINTPLKTLAAAIELGNKNPGRSKIYVMGGSHTSEFNV